jgi:hypothetical protein
MMGQAVYEKRKQLIALERNVSEEQFTIWTIQGSHMNSASTFTHYSFMNQTNIIQALHANGTQAMSACILHLYTSFRFYIK